jgi:hypothetical protein
MRENLLSWEVEQSSPKVEFISPQGGEILSGVIKVEWSVAAYRKPPLYILRYSNNGGRTWRAVAERLKRSNCEVDLDNFPPGDQCVFQVLASEGFRTGAATSGEFSVPPRSRTVSIVQPKDGANFFQGQSIQLFGFVSAAGESVDPEELNWSSNVNGFLGTGDQLAVHALSTGRHFITLEADDGCGGRTAKTIRITVLPKADIRKMVEQPLRLIAETE